MPNFLHIKSLDYTFSSFWLKIAVIFLAIFSSVTILRDMLISIAIIFVAFSVILFIKKPVWALAILITAGINFFGAVRIDNLPSIKLSGLGGLYIYDIFLLLFIGIMFLKLMIGTSKSIRSSIGYPIIALILLTGFQAIRSFLEGNDPHFILNNMRPFAFYFFFFLVLGSLRTEDELIEFMKLVVFIAIITAGVTYFQTITGGLSLASLVTYRKDYSIYQSLNLGMFVMTCTFLTLFSSLLAGKKISNKVFLSTNMILLFWIGGAILVMFMRNIWASTLLAMGIIIILNISKINKYITILFLIVAFFIIVMIPVIEHYTGSQKLLYLLSDRTLTAYQDIIDISGSFGKRTELLKHRWDYMIHNNPVFGQGFRGTSLSLSFDLSYWWDPTYARGENTVADLAVRYGLSGFFVFSWLLFAVFRKAIRLFRVLPDSWQKSLVCGLLAFNIHIVISSYFGIPLLSIYGTVILAPSWAILELIDRFHKQKQMKNLVDRVD